MKELNIRANQLMDFVWELNTLVNGTHEGRCLLRHFEQRGEEFLQYLQKIELADGQQEFLDNEFELAVPRLSEEMELLQKIVMRLEQAKQIVKTKTTHIDS